ncbi:MAG: C-GCAxxG-C-C family protein [Dehalobacterium sp.]|jgi:C_GCAxxG_C_C family probable redox protein
MDKDLSLDEIDELYSQGYTCAQIVLAQAGEKMGLDRSTALKMACPFACGMFHGETCGCVAAALMVLGLKYGQDQPYDLASRRLVLQKKTEFENKFKEAHGSLICRDLLGLDVHKPSDMGKIAEEGLQEKVCYELIWDTNRILNEMIG